MKISEVEERVGITKKNIRFYEAQGLLEPGRNRENGYREYSVEDVRTLEQIKLLRKLGLPLLVILGVLFSLVQRIEEIKRGEEDEAKKY